MAFKQKENTGSLFKNDRREKDTHPHAQGSALIDGVEYWISAWTKDGEKGKWQSLAFKRKEIRAGDPDLKKKPSGGAPDTDDIPFAPLRKVESSLL